MKADQPLISVIIPNYNNAHHLAYSVQSIIAQGYENTEVLVVDDGSTDNSCEVALKITDSRVRFLPQPENRGVSCCRNIGINSASGEYISTLDSDDLYINPDKLSNELRVLKKHQQESGIDVVAFSNTAFIDPQNKVTGLVGNDLQPIEEGNLYEQFWRRSAFVPRDYLVRRSVLIDSGLYDEELRMYEDFDLKLRLAKNYTFYYSGDIGTGYRRQGGLSRSPKAEHTRWLKRIREKHGVAQP